MPQGWCDANLDSFCAHRRQRCAGRDEETDSEIHSEGTRCATLANSLTKKAPYKGRGADSGEKHEPVSDIDTAMTDSLKALDPNRPIREADVLGQAENDANDPKRTSGSTSCCRGEARFSPIKVFVCADTIPTAELEGR